MEVIKVLLVVVGTVLVVGLGVIGLLRLLGIEVYPAPSFPCRECCQSNITTYRSYECQACLDEIYGTPLTCQESRGTRDCWKNARKMNYEQQD